MKKELGFIIAITIAIAGCAPKMEILPGSVKKSKYAPTNQNQEAGIVSYDQGDEDMEEEAYKLMFDTCGGKYKILNKDIKHISDGIIGLGDKNTAGGLITSEEKVYVKFICQ